MNPYIRRKENYSTVLKQTLLLVFQAIAFCLAAQNDSTLMLETERLGEKDLVPRDERYQVSKAISATRTLDVVNDMPFRVWVIPAEDILQNGYVTLGDVLKAVPGIRVSQPGSAVEGEMFMYRGLSGNQYMKILINDVPIKATVAQGFGIGAQLPIRQAERIEIAFGPSSAIYGNEACAGTINIILKESERPLFTQAHLSFGNSGFNNIDAMFGGKLGRDRKILRFSIYGSSTVRNRNDLYNNISPWVESGDGIIPFGLGPLTYYKSPNIYFNNGSERLTTLNHESRLLGLNVSYRGWRFSYHRMQRNDHNALGLNALASTASNPGNLLKENSDVFMLTFRRKRKKRESFTSFSFNRYAIDGYSNSTHILHQLSNAFLKINETDLVDLILAEDLVDTLYRRFASGPRFSYANGFDGRLETRIQWRIGKKLFWSSGITAMIGGGFARYSYLTRRIESGFFGGPSNVTPINPSSNGDGELGLQNQLVWRGSRLNVILGTNVLSNLSSLLEDFAFVNTPRLGFSFKIDSNLTLKGNYATGFRRPPVFAASNSYTLLPDAKISAPEAFNDPEQSGIALKLERTQSYEASIAYNIPTLFAEAGGFRQQVFNKISPGHLEEYDTYNQGKYWHYGYMSTSGLAQEAWGAFGLIRLQNIETEKIRNRKKERASAYLEYFIQYFNGREIRRTGTSSQREVKEIANAPRWLNQFRWSFNPTNNIHLVLASTRMSSTLSQSIFYRDAYKLDGRQERYGKFRTWDMTMRWSFNKNFALQAQILNMFGKEYAGIDATGTTDDMIFNPQHGRLWRIGANYNMDR
jgi:outer membrane receptor for ferrienterochelin and colicin